MKGFRRSFTLLALFCSFLVLLVFANVWAEKAVVNFWWALGEGEPYYKQNKDFVDAFNSKNPDYEVRPQSMSWNDIRNKAVIAARAGNPPEMVESIPEWVTEYYQLGYLQDLTSWYASYPEKDKIYPVAIEALTYDGKLVAIPEYFGIRALLYHEDMLKKAGFTRPPKTWKELQEYGKKLTKNGVYAFGFCGQSVRAPQEIIVYFWQSGIDIVKPLGNGKFKNTWKENPAELAAATEVFQFYYDNVFKYKISPQAAISWGYNEEDTNFASGKLAMCVNGPWMQAYEKQFPKEMADVKIAMIPYNKQPATFLEVLSVCIFKDSKYPKQAYDFATQIMSREYQTTANRGQPIRKDIPVSGNKWIEGFMNLVPHGKFIPHVSFGQISKSMIDSLQAVLLKKFTPKQAASWLADEINKALAASGELGE